jgi:hypothetical protein
MKNLAGASGWCCLRTAGEGLLQSSSCHPLGLPSWIYCGSLSHHRVPRHREYAATPPLPGRALDGEHGGKQTGLDDEEQEDKGAHAEDRLVALVRTVLAAQHLGRDDATDPVPV